MSAYKDGYSLCLPGPHSPDCQASPMSQLAQCFTGLSAFQTGDTPRRCLDLSNISAGSPDAGAPQGSPQQDKPVAPPVNSDSPVPSFRNSRLKKLRSVLPRLLCSSPRSSEDPSSSKENVPPRQRPGSTSGALPALEAHLHGDTEPCALGSPIFLLPPSPTPHPTGEGGADSFMDDLEQESEEGAAAGSMSCSMAQLLSEPLMNKDMDLSSVSGRVPGSRRLFRSPSMPERLQRPAGKRGCTSPAAAARPFKRHCSSAGVDEEARPGGPEPGDARQRRHLLKKTHSLCEVAQTLGGDALNPELIGDFSKMYALPTVSGRHQDLKYITGETMCALLEGRFSSLVEGVVLVDCRYPYEFQGGHIKGALNLPNAVEAVDFLLSRRLRARAPEKRLVLVLHCEFSSERGPCTSRLLRSEDRSVNEYPALHYPEIYLLKGGYRDFFHAHKEHCDPRSYCPMHHQDHREELLRCRTDSRASVDEHRRRQLLVRLGKH